MVHSSQLQFTRDGRTLVVAEPDLVTLIEVRSGGRRRIAISGAQAVAAFADQIWVATETGALIRLARDGRKLDEHELPADPDGVLIPTAIGAPAALWAAREAMMVVDDLGALSILPSHIDAGIPVAGRRFAHYAGLRLTVPAGRSTTLARGLAITGGSVVFDGSSLALITEHARGREIAMVALASGCSLQTVSLPGGTVRIAARRGLAVASDGAGRLAIIDLGAARALGSIATDDDVTDLAIDPDGDLLALRLAGGDLELAPVRERMDAPLCMSGLHAVSRCPRLGASQGQLHS